MACLACTVSPSATSSDSITPATGLGIWIEVYNTDTSQIQENVTSTMDLNYCRLAQKVYITVL